MKLEKILDKLNSLEKNAFLKIIDNIISNNPENKLEIEKILTENNKNLKEVDNIIIAKVLNLVGKEFSEVIKHEFEDTLSQLDILIDIIIRDGNNLIKEDWFAKLYDKAIRSIKTKTCLLEEQLESEKSDISEQRKRDYRIYKSCVHTAYINDEINNRDKKITSDELSILLTLSKELDLSQEEVKLINYMVIPPVKLSIEEIINDLKSLGVIFYSKKNRFIYVADDMVILLRKIRQKQIADKFYSRFLKLLREPLINSVCRNHNIEIKQELHDKIKAIINEGISFSNLLTNELHKEGTSLTDKKKFITEIWENGLNMTVPLRGTTLEDKISSLIKYFEDIERDDRVGISIDGYTQLLADLDESFPDFNKIIRSEFEMQTEFVLTGEFLLDFNIKPQDILDVLPKKDIMSFCDAYNLKKRGNTIQNILDAYKDADNLLIENYINVGKRDINLLKENGITIKEAELGVKFEDITRAIFEKLGFNVDEEIRHKLNNKKNKMDLVLNIGDEGLIIIECKTVKESGYNKFSSVTRQMKAYKDLATDGGYNVVKSLLVAPDFSPEFINDCDLDFQLNLSLITAETLTYILEAFKNSVHKQFPYQLLMKDVLIKEDRILKAICKN